MLANPSVTTQELPIEDAKAQGAVMMFGERYGDVVRVVSIGDASKELCGGCHVSEARDIYPFKILSEGSIAAGVRRIEVCGVFALLLHSPTQHELTCPLSLPLPCPGCVWLGCHPVVLGPVRVAARNRQHRGCACRHPASRRPCAAMEVARQGAGKGGGGTSSMCVTSPHHSGLTPAPCSATRPCASN